MCIRHRSTITDFFFLYNYYFYFYHKENKLSWRQKYFASYTDSIFLNSVFEKKKTTIAFVPNKLGFLRGGAEKRGEGWGFMRVVRMTCV